MSDNRDKNYQLIIRQRPVAGPELEVLLQALQQKYGLEAYTARQRLLGPGLAMFGKGSRQRTGQIASLLKQYGYACWQIESQVPIFAPDRMRSLTIHDNHILFEGQKGSVQLARGAAVVGVLADLSGALVEKHVKRLLAQNTYRGNTGREVLAQDEMVQAIFQGQPVFDFYLLDGQGRVESGVRVLPGRFNVDGLGSRAALSTRQNLESVIELVAEYAGAYRLYCDFGLSQLPKCALRRSEESPGAVVENLDSLTRYGWLVCQLTGDRTSHRNKPDDDDAPSVSLAAAAVIGQPGLAAVPDGDTTPLSNPWQASGDSPAALQDDESLDTPVATPPIQRDLPPPPPRPDHRQFNRMRTLMMAGGVLAGLTISVGSGGDELFRLFTRYGMAAGVVPAIVAVVLFWSGFYYFALKRRIENTPTSRIRSIAMGLVEVHGRVRRQYALVAPMTETACAWYRLRKYRKDSRNNWKLVKEIDSNHVPFLIDDGTGRVVVDPAGASVKTSVRQTGYPGQSPLTFTAFSSHSDEDEKWVEDLIYEGTSLYVLGFAQPLREERQTLRERTLVNLRQLKLDPQALHRYDINGDGCVDEAEWEVARADAEQAALADHLAERVVRKRQEEHVVIARPPQRSLPFIIAETVSEAALVKKYGWLSAPLLLAGGVATGIAIYKLIQYLQF